MRKVLVVLVSAMCLGACSTMDTPYDPNIYKGQTLFEQIPNNTDESHCAGHLKPEQRKSWQTGRC
jgi:hypothetical protein